MWFDCIIIDKITIDGNLESYHIRARNGEQLTVDRLEDIDTSYRAVTSKDMAGIRLYEDDNIESRVLQSKLENFEITSDSVLRLQLDHWHVPVTFGYYSIIFPKGFRIRDVKIYDPCDATEDIYNKRNYKRISSKWDSAREYSCAQILMQSKRGTFSLGVSAALSHAESGGMFADRAGRIEVDFTEPRHKGHMWEKTFRWAADEVANIVTGQDPRFPDVKVGLSGPSISLNETWKYAAHQWKRWRTVKSRPPQ